jgi:hypothetical protein
MAARRDLSIEELARRNFVVPLRIAALDLETGMVLLIGDKLRVVISVSYENRASGPVALIETVGGFERMAADARVEVWHVEGRPFLVDAPEEEPGPFMVGRAGGSSTPPAQDAAGIVPVWRDRNGPTSGSSGSI